MTTPKGDYFEELIRQRLTNLGYAPSPPKHGSHVADMLFIKDDHFYAVDAKAKAARRDFADTGIEWKHIVHYINLERQGVTALAFFGDHHEGSVYGASLADLVTEHRDPPGCKPGHYPRKEGEILYFPRSVLTRWFDLSPEERRRLAELSRKDVKQPGFF